MSAPRIVTDGDGKRFEVTPKGWRPLDELTPNGNGAGTLATDEVPPESATGLHLARLSEVRAERTRFAWEPWLPLRSLSIVAGNTGLGKSTLAAELAARVSRGQLVGDLKGEPRDVLIASAEDSVAATIRPRVELAGGDLERVHVVTMRRDGLDFGLLIPSDLAALREAAERTEAALVVVDPMMAHIPAEVDSFKDQSTRLALAPLHRLAEDCDLTVLLVAHLNKRESASLLSRLGGSVAFHAAARSVVLVAEDPNDADRRVLAHDKANLSERAESLSFRLEARELANPNPADPEPIRVAGIAWLGTSDLDAEALLGVRTSTAEGSAVAWLAAMLAGSGQVSAAWLQEQADKAGHKVRTLRRAADDLGVRKSKAGMEGGWTWALPE